MSVVEKSDSPKVARKQANKAATAAAELVERRGGAKEKAELQSTDRTQSREAVSQAQAVRVRNREAADQLGPRCRYPGVLRHGQPGLADPFCRAPHRRSPGRKTDPQVVGSRGSRRRPADRDGAGDASG